MSDRNQQQELTDSELLQLARDSRMTSREWALLTPSEQSRMKRLASPTTQPKDTGSSAFDTAKSALSFGGDLLSGVAKGAGETAFNLGNAVHSIPGLGNLTDMIAELVGPKGTNPDQAFAQVPEDLTATNAGQKIGKAGERIAEFVLPSKAEFTAGNLLARPALNAWLRTSQKTQPVLSAALTAAEKGLNIAGDAGMAGLVGAAQGGDPIDAAKWSAGGALAGEGASQLLRTLSTDTGQRIGPLLAAIAAMKAVEGVGGSMGDSMGGALGGFSIAKGLANKIIKQPGAVRRIRDAAELAGTRAGQIGAGVMNANSTPRRRSQQ